jgi:hypothetical protein
MTILCRVTFIFAVARTCSELKEKGMKDSTRAEIDPDGRAPAIYFWVYCDMESEDGVGVTVLG